MNGITITLTLDSLDQLRGLERALEVFCDTESERLRDVEKDPDGTTKREIDLDRAILLGARAVRRMIEGR